jgi:23S rRNA (uracil1939-C5)-methyltransferase
MKLRIEKAIYGGAGLGRVDGKAVFVAGALPGELVEANLNRDRGSYAEATLTTVLEPSPERIDAACPYYGTCGGCQYQHATYAAQPSIKESILVESLARAGINDVPPVTRHTAEPWGYRNRIRLHVHPATHKLCYREGNSHRLVPVSSCPIAAPVLQQALIALQTISAAQNLGAWCGSVEFFTNHNGSQLLLHLVQSAVLSKPAAQLNRLCATATEQIPTLIGSALFPAPGVGPGSQRVRRGAPSKSQRGKQSEPEDEAGTPIATWGQPWLTYTVGASSYRVSAGAFFQGNRFLVETLQSIATSDVEGSFAWDLYGGVGLFALALQQHGMQVPAVEGSPISGADLVHNLAADSPRHAGKAIRTSTLSFLQRETRDNQVPDHIVLDPPRAGLGLEATALLAGVQSQSITYVSCDAATLARDLRVLVDAGYTITQLHLVDMFPQTFHLETVVKLRLR